MPRTVQPETTTVWRYHAEHRSALALSQANHRLILERLAARAPFAVPAVTGDFDGWLLTGPIDGIGADQPDRHPDPDDLVVAIGTGLAALHDLGPELAEDLTDRPDSEGRPDSDGLPGSEGWEVVAARATMAVEAGLVDPLALPQPYRRYTASQLLAMFIDGRPSRDGDEQHRVVCHGSPSLDRFGVEKGRFCGLDRFDLAFVGDRHVDLAVTHQSVAEVMGPEAVFRFYEAYGRDPDLPRLEHHILGRHLTARLVGAEAITVPARG